MARLRASKEAVPGGELATELGVSRQVVVQDIAILRAAGAPIVATSRGYLLPEDAVAPELRATFACRHRPEETVEELYVFVDHGLRVVDVVVDHPFYGELRGTLMLESRADIDAWWTSVLASGARLLSELTDGLHLHTLEARRVEGFAAARYALRARGFLVEEATPERAASAL